MSNRLGKDPDPLADYWACGGRSIDICIPKYDLLSEVGKDYIVKEVLTWHPLSMHLNRQV